MPSVFKGSALDINSTDFPNANIAPDINKIPVTIGCHATPYNANRGVNKYIAATSDITPVAILPILTVSSCFNAITIPVSTTIYAAIPCENTPGSILPNALIAPVKTNIAIDNFKNPLANILKSLAILVKSNS